MSEHTIQPFGYFKSESFGWTDCAETDEGARPLYDQDAIDALTKQRDELLTAADRYKFLSERLRGADFDWNETGDTVLVFDWPTNVEISADCDKTIDAAIESVKDHSEQHLGMVKGGAA